MRTSSSFCVAVGFAILAGAYSTVLAQMPSSVLNGIFTEAQGKRGEKVFADNCAACHGPKLEGGTAGPPLAGPDFFNGWKDMTAGALLSKIAMDMPSSAPGTLMPQEYADVMAYILTVNKYPAGTTELPTDPSALKTVKMAAPNP